MKLQDISEQGFDAQTGFGPVTWDSWQDVWTGSTKKSTRNKAGYKEEIETELRLEHQLGRVLEKSSRKYAETSFGDDLNSQVIPFVRSDVQFSAKGMRLFTRIYPLMLLECQITSFQNFLKLRWKLEY